MDLVKQNKRLEEQLRSADALSKTNRSDVEETARRHQLKFNRLKSEKEEREKELMQRIQVTKDEYRIEVELHTRAESKLAALETEVAKLKKKAMRDGKKVRRNIRPSKTKHLYIYAIVSSGETGTRVPFDSAVLVKAQKPTSASRTTRGLGRLSSGRRALS